MTSTEKIISDARRIARHDRSDHAGAYDALRACEGIAALFEKNYRSLAELPYSAVQFWVKKYIEPSDEIQNEPTEEHLEKLGAIACFLEGSAEGTECLCAEDWAELADCARYQAEDIDLNALSAMMAVLVEKGAL